MSRTAVIRIAVLSTVLCWTVQSLSIDGLVLAETSEASVLKVLETQEEGEGPLFEFFLNDPIVLLSGISLPSSTPLEVGCSFSAEARLGAILKLRGPPVS